MTVLVTAASRHGSTTEIAQAMADGLIRRGVPAEVRAPADVPDLHRYDAVVLGSAVYAGHWLAEAKTFVDRLADQLVTRDVWLFSSGPVGVPLQPEEEAVDVTAERQHTAARDHRTFPGRIDRGRLGFAERALVRALRVPDGDFRDWSVVDEWAGSIASDLGRHA